MIVPTLEPVAEEAMEEESSVGSRTINNSITCSFCVPLLSAVRMTVFVLSSGVFLSSLADKMEGNECEREEN